MVQHKQAFTLIELLVVVLVISILAAVAVPQYQTAVLKSRMSQAYVAVKAIYDAEQVFFVANGYYTPVLAELEIEPMNCSSADASESSSEKRVYYNCANGLTIKMYDNTSIVSIYAFIVGTDKELDQNILGLEYGLNTNSRLCVSNYIQGQKTCMSMGGQFFANQSKGRKYYTLP
ncbi:MAG: prepilin-type N-terminal cleavage/methylation domain-containing protein [Elusimicrobiaceae bacterium]|nr:prepilin-type N-terminal cleavage/methylation domain-containing protein [Elusimicrobiaceae bacterium]